ncbi:MAG: protein kinase [Kofleriaceae bacterium]|nr:protein kinase [Kofleriaceae bacterium]
MSTGDLTGAVLDDRYKVIEAVAQGAMGVVYRAERLKLGKIVAIKVLHDELPDELSSRKRFEIEATAMAKLEHPNCAAVLDVGTHMGRPYVVMDFITGADLTSLVEQGPVPVARAVDILKQVLSGIAHAHELGIIHRDIKPANIILSQKTGLGDHVKILDFGLARLQAEQTSKLTTGIVVGTPAYMAPEQIRGVGIDTRADLYACSVLLFELLTAQKPFHSEKDDPIEVVQMHLKQPPPRLDEMLHGVEFGELEAVVAKALAKSPDDRYQTAAEFSAALDGAVRQSAVSLAPTEPAGKTLTDSQAQVISESMMMPSGDTQPDSKSQVISESMMMPSGGTRLGLVAVATPPTGSPVTPQLSPTAETYVPQAAQPPAALSSASALVSPISPPVVEPDPMGQMSAINTNPRPVEKPLVPGLTNKQLKLGGGVVGGILAIGLIAKCASGGGDASKQPTAVTTGSGSAEIEMGGTSADGADKILARADELIANGEQAAALTLLDKSAPAFPQNADIPYRAGKLYFAKLWWNDGLRHFRNAVRIDPTLKTDPELIKLVLKAFITTPDYNDTIADFLHQDIGPMAAQYLEETARDHPNKAIRARAKRELERY